MLKWLQRPVFVCLLAASTAGALFQACSSTSTPDENKTLHIVSGSENQALEPILRRFEKRNGVKLDIQYKGSVDIMLMLEDDQPPADAVWPANSLWITLGDKNKVVKDSESIMRSPVVLGVKRSVAEKAGWIGRDVHMQDILDSAEKSKLRLMMTSATQSNSGASAYFGFLYAFANNPPVLTHDNLNDPAVQEKVKRFLGLVNRSSQSSGFLKDLFLSQYDDFDAMVNYESLVIEANQQLVKDGHEPLYAIYPVDGLAIADSPLAYVSKGNTTKEQTFTKLQQYLLSDDVQREIRGLGRRVGVVGLEQEQADTSVFNPDWGIDVSRVIAPIKFPQADVIREALDLYQNVLRKPSLTVYCLDFSGSMKGDGERDLKEAMTTLLDQQSAAKYLLQASPNDVNVVLIFNGDVVNGADVASWTVLGNSPVDLGTLLAKIQAQRPDGNTDIYEPVDVAIDVMKARGISDRFPSVILMTDGQSNHGSFDEMRRHIEESGLTSVPVYAITFGDASTEQLQQITELTHGRVFDGTKDLITAFRNARGNN